MIGESHNTFSPARIKTDDLYKVYGYYIHILKQQVKCTKLKLILNKEFTEQ